MSARLPALLIDGRTQLVASTRLVPIIPSGLIEATASDGPARSSPSVFPGAVHILTSKKPDDTANGDDSGYARYGYAWSA